jgi:hypothetical protein
MYISGCSLHNMVTTASLDLLLISSRVLDGYADRPAGRRPKSRLPDVSVCVWKSVYYVLLFFHPDASVVHVYARCLK